MNEIEESKNLRNEKLQRLEKFLRGRIRGQDHVMPRIVSALQRGELGLSKSSRPKGSFLFLGPTGVGKTETAIAFTDFLMSRENLFRFDMSEYQTQDSLGILLGAKIGERGTLSFVLEKSTTGTLLFDEIEKAHPRVLDVFLQILDAARVTLADGETIDCSGFYIVFTSNLGAAELVNLQHSSFSTMERHVLTRAQQAMRPELFARISEKLVFNRLSYERQLEIAELLLTTELSFLRELGHELTPESGVLPFLVQKGFHPRLGARPMRDAVEKFVGDAVATALLKGNELRASLTVSAAKQCLEVV